MKPCLLTGGKAIERAIYDKNHSWHKILFPEETPDKALAQRLDDPTQWQKLVDETPGHEIQNPHKNGKTYIYTWTPLPVLALKQILAHQLSQTHPLLWRVRLGKTPISTASDHNLQSPLKLAAEHTSYWKAVARELKLAANDACNYVATLPQH